jgi:hypothetical protein
MHWLSESAVVHECSNYQELSSCKVCHRAQVSAWVGVSVGVKLASGANKCTCLLSLSGARTTLFRCHHL